jgi:hypothetical protein
MGILFSTIYFYFLTTIFGDYKDTSTRWKAFVIVLAGGIVQAVCILKFPQQIGVVGTLLLSTGTMVLLLVGWCRISLLSAIKIVGCFLAGCLLLSLGIQSLSSQASG